MRTFTHKISAEVVVGDDVCIAKAEIRGSNGVVEEFEGSAKRHPSDPVNHNVGASLAMGRALAKAARAALEYAFDEMGEECRCLCRNR